MELNVFITELQKALIQRGISAETAEKHTASLKKSFNDSDLDEIRAMETTDEVNILADSIATILNRKKAAQQQQETMADVQPTQTLDIPVIKQSSEATDSRQNDNDEFFEFDADEEGTQKGKTVFWVGLVLTLPISIALLAVIFGSFAAMFSALFALILALIALIVIVVAGGAACSLVGIIYGITQLFVFVEAGIYEIGLGITVIGIVILLSVLLYNSAVRLLPWVIKKLGVFFKFVCRKLKSLFLYIRRECYKL